MRLLPFLILALGAGLGGSAGAGGGAGLCEVQETDGAFPGGILSFGTGVGIKDGLAVITTIGASLDLEGSAHVYRVTASGLSLQTVLHSGVVACQNAFGNSAATDGTVIAVADYAEGTPECGRGAVYVYRVDDGTPAFEQKLKGSNGAAFDRFGVSVAVLGDAIVVGAWDHDTNGVPDSGAAYVFRFVGGSWHEEAMLAAPVPEAYAAFGVDVSIAGDVVMVGAHGDDGPALNTGAAYVFRYREGKWTFEQELKPCNLFPCTSQDWFGVAVALDGAGDTAVIGAAQDLGQLGSAFVFEYDGSGWVETTRLQAGQSFGSPAGFGAEVAISQDGQTILVGAPGDSQAGFEAGAAHLFRRVGDAWVEVDKFIKPGSSCLGARVRLDGDLAIVSDQCEEPGGKAYLLAGMQAIDCNGNGEPDSCDIVTGRSADADGNGIPDECAVFGDVDGDGFVGIVDLLALLAGWADCPQPCPPSCPGDLDGDCAVGITDLLLLLGVWTVPPPPPACPGGGGDCCVAHASAGCDDPACCAAVCTADSFCCDVVWDTVCAGESQAACGCPPSVACGGGPAAGECCAYGGLPGPGCNNAACCEAICVYVDPFCCDVQWDGDCTIWALQLCDCPPIACSPDAGPCCTPVPQPGPGCNDLECCTLICEQFDPFCCDAGWDMICVDEAQELCKVCGGQPP